MTVDCMAATLVGGDLHCFQAIVACSGCLCVIIKVYSYNLGLLHVIDTWLLKFNVLS